MRCVILVFAWFAIRVAALGQPADASRPATPDELALLKDAMAKSTQETERWAYTETRSIKLSKGHARGDTVVRFDPSLPYAEQFTPIKIDGKEPTERQRADYRKRGEKRGQQVARAAEAARGNPVVTPPSLKISGARVSLDVERARFFRDDPQQVTFEIPVSGESRDVPLDSFQILVRIGKTTRVVENIHLRVIDSFHVKLIAKVKAGEADFDFTIVDPKYSPVLSRMTGDLDVSVMFIPLNGVFLNERTDYRRVKAYDERFEVKLGPLKAVDF